VDRCPTCDQPLDLTTAAGHSVQGCSVCGGVYIAAADLAALLKDAPDSLGLLGRRFAAGLTARAGAVGDPICRRCGKLMIPRRFPAAPTLPIHACAACRTVWLTDGQPEALRQTVAPSAEPPRWQHYAALEAAKAAEEANAPGLREVRGHGPGGLWPERAAGQPWFSWIVCGMPLWMAPLFLLPVGLVLWASISSDLKTAPYALFGLAAPFVIWLPQTLVMTLALQTVWALADDNPGLGFGETFVLLLRVVPVAFCFGYLAGVAMLPFERPMLCLLSEVAVSLTVYRKAMELEWREIFVLGVLLALLGLSLIASAIG